MNGNNRFASIPEVPLIASACDLRVSLGEQVPESDFRAALESGESGFVHSFSTGSVVDGPGVRVVAWLAGCQFRCVYCHNPDTWKLTNGMPINAWVAYMIASNEIETRHRVDLDTTIKTLAGTGRDMGSKYKETSEGGLAAHLVLC